MDTIEDKPRKWWRGWKIALAIISGIVLVPAFIFVAVVYIRYYSFMKPIVHERPGLRFEALACNGDHVIANYNDRSRVESSTWDSDGALTINAKVFEGCSMRPTTGDYTINGSTMALSYSTNVPQGPQAACDCQYHISYRISNIPRADYKLTLSKSSAKIP